MSSTARRGGGKARLWAEEAHALVEAQPRKALALAERARSAASTEGDRDAEVAALHSLAWAQLRLGDAQASVSTIRLGLRLARRQGDPQAAALLRRLLAAALALSGRTRAAQREMDAAIAELSGLERARSQVHRLAMYRRSGAADPGAERSLLRDASAGLRTLRRARDDVWEARLLTNRGIFYFDRGILDRAEADFRRASAIWVRLRAHATAADTALALAEVHLLRGEVVACLKAIDEVPADLQPGPLTNLGRLRVLALTQSRLLPEARVAGEEYVALCGRTGRGDYVAEGLLDLATISVLAGEPVAAQAFASRAVRSFAAHGKHVNASLARVAYLRAGLAAGAVGRSSLRSGLDAVAVLDGSGWHRDALRARVVAARVALRIGARTTARRQLTLARPLKARGSAVDRIELCQAEALLALADGRPEIAEQRLGRGMHLVDEYRAALGAVELRASASGIGVELAERGLGIALESKQPAKVLAWAERLRASALRLPPVRPPADRRLRELQTELRRAVANGQRGEQPRIEAAIRARARVVEAGDGMPSLPSAAREAERRLGERALVEYVERDGRLHAVTLVGGKLVLHELGPSGAKAELDWLRFAYTRLAARRITPEHRAATAASAAASASALDELLVRPLLPAIGTAPLVLVPTGTLHAVPWAALPSLTGRPLVVTPSLAAWNDLDRKEQTRRRKRVLVAGPRLRHAYAEARQLAALTPGSTLLTGREATAAATLAGLDGCKLAHLACHGHFRADSPLFSSLELADGLLNVYALQQLKLAPEIVVLAACDVALSSVHPGDELLGLAAALLGMGTRTIVASVVPVPDAAGRRLMLAFHRQLVAGARPATALAHAQAQATVPGFVCLGSG
jgi:hypothetical protein